MGTARQIENKIPIKCRHFLESTIYQQWTCIFAGQCISNCEGLPDGKYKSCGDCDTYSTCLDGKLEENILCPPDHYWDDKASDCVVNSQTCQVITGKSQAFSRLTILSLSLRLRIIIVHFICSTSQAQ